jgi:hypothetical protein
VKVIHGDVHSFFHDSAVPVQRGSCRPEKSAEHRIRERAPEINGSMFTDRQKLHQHKLVTSDASEESFFRVIRPIN